MTKRDEEIRRLRGCIDDLRTLQALPALWRGWKPPEMVGSLLDVLLRTLHLDLAYARLSVPGTDARIEAVRLPEGEGAAALARDVGRSLDRWLSLDAPTSSRILPNPLGPGEISAAHVWFGSTQGAGVVVGGSHRARFPSDLETLM